jgi:signal transduction histidine kinase
MPERTRWPRQRSIRALLSLGLVVPLVCLLALWGFGAAVTMTRAAAMHDFTTADRLYSGPAQALSSALAAEQLQTVAWLSAGRVGPLGPLRAQFRATDRAAASFLVAARADQPVISSSAQAALHAVESLLAGRLALRAAARAGRLSPLAAVEAYGAILSAVNGFDASLLVVADTSLSRQAAATVEADGGVDLADADVALVTGAAGAGGVMSTPERVLFAQDAAQARLMVSGALMVLNPALGSGYLRATSSTPYRAFVAAEDHIASSAGDAGVVPVDTSALAAASTTLTADYQAAERQDAAGLASLAAQAGGTATLAEALVAGLGLVALVLSAVLAIDLWWRIIRAVTRLQDAALTLTGDQLPGLGQRHSDADASRGPAPRVRWPTGSIREIANASAALSAAQQLARQATAAQDQLRSGASQFLRNLGLRSHALANRQITLLDVIERGTSDPQTLAGLAAVGQLSTRMRRHADGLLVLSGGSLARSEQSLVISDLIRAATADVDDGSRISVASDSPDAVTAEAVADVAHLIAELVDNAVRHTPQLAEVTVRAGRVGRGLVVEVEDDGPGFDLERANALLADPPDIGLAVGDGLGLLVVARLAARHRLRVNLRSSPTGGTTAIVLLPHAILAAGEVRDTIVDGSLPRIDVTMPPPAAPPSGYGAPTLPQRVADPGAAPPTRRAAPYRSPQPTVTTTTAAPAESTAPWYWLAASQPARTSAPEPPGAATDEPSGEASDPGAPAPLPRRIRPTAQPAGRSASGTAPSPGQDQAAAPGPADRDPDDGTGAQQTGDS